MTRDLRNDRWTCPNDRNLQLRSKLNAGWSYHTGKKTVLKKDPQLTESELIEIQKVLQRSEMVERNERDRVLKLVERLENMKRNVNQSIQSPNRCSLCGDYFCIIRTMPSHCSFCQKILCSKCCIETQYSEGDTNFSHVHSRRNSISSLCSSNSSKMSVYLCRLCSEQREFLKKSGAWFLKKYPSYISNMGDSNGSSSPNLSQMEQNSPCLKQKKIRNVNSQNTSFPNSSSSNSSSFKIWNKAKESTFHNNDFDDISDFSNDNDLNYNNESISNYDANSVRNFSTSNENIHSKTQNKETNANQHSPKENNTHNNSFKRHNHNTAANQSNDSTQLNSPVNNLNNKASPNSNSTSNSAINNFSDEEGNSPNMTNYNYYSSIINNLKPDENPSLIQGTVANNVNNTNNINNNISNNTNNLKSKTVGLNNISKKIKTSVLETKNNKNLEANTAAHINNNNNDLLNGTAVFNSNSFNNFDLSLNNKIESTKSYKKPKLLEWCSSQLSIDKMNPPKFKSSRNKLEIDESDKNNDKKSKSFKFMNNISKSQHSSPAPLTKNPLHQNSSSNKNNNIENNFISTSSMTTMMSNQGASAHNLANTLNKLNLN